MASGLPAADFTAILSGGAASLLGLQTLNRTIR